MSDPAQEAASEDGVSDPARGDPCKKCGGPLVVKPRMFALQGIGTFSGLVCERCRSLWNDPEDSFLHAATMRARLRRALGKGEEESEAVIPEYLVETLTGQIERNDLAVRCLRDLRSMRLDHPNTLLGVREPPYDALWGYVMALTRAIDVLEGKDRWHAFLESKGFGARTEYHVLVNGFRVNPDGFDERVAAFRELISEYETWRGS